MTKQPSAFRSVPMTVQDVMALESSVRAQLECQSFSFWVLAAIFRYLREVKFVPPDQEIFRQFVDSMSRSLSAQTRASASVASFLKQKRREWLVSFLPPTSKTVKSSLLSTTSSETLFSEDVCALSFCVREDSSLTTRAALAKALLSF